ncbi:MAG: hypothetical protein QME58_12525 [Bacteroidota bacterium]|nr:hypothetical protein [Bacteroidota bacterium]
MARNKLHISLIIGFTAIFVVFNIGLPVVLHYCEMMNTYSSSDCDMCHPETKQDEQIQFNSMQYSCCKTVIVADRNTSEFLQAQKDEATKLQYSITPTAICGLHSSPRIDFQYSSKIFLTGIHSPPSYKDIPILFSSLLI